MDEQKIRQIVRQEIQGNSSASRFSINTMPRHTHNNIDSPYVFQQNLIYAGEIAANGGPMIFPKGWGIVQNPAGVYTITHNLGPSALKIINVTAFNNDLPVSAVVQGLDNSFSVAMILPAGTLTQNGFYFTLIVLNNRSQALPVYYGSTLG